MKDLEIQGGQLNYLLTLKCYNLYISFIGYKTFYILQDLGASMLHEEIWRNLEDW